MTWAETLNLETLIYVSNGYMVTISHKEAITVVAGSLKNLWNNISYMQNYIKTYLWLPF